MGGGGGVGVQDEAPAFSVDAHVVVVLACHDAIPGGCLAAVALVPQVMHVAAGGGPLAAGPFAVTLGAELDRAVDRGRDVTGVANAEEDDGWSPGTPGDPEVRGWATGDGVVSPSGSRVYGRGAGGIADRTKAGEPDLALGGPDGRALP